jgi:hypothetical protein
VSHTRGEFRAAMVLAGALAFSYAYFYQAGGWNQNSRFALVRAILERHTLRIDAYQLHTGDRAIWREHYYSDKAPGASLTSLVPVQAARFVSLLAHVDPASFPGIAFTSYIATVATSGVFTVAAALAVFWLSLRWGATRGAALFAATAYGIGSPAWAYATLFMGHGQTAGCLMIAFVAAEILGEPDGPAAAGHHTPMPAQGRRALAFIVGLSGGWAVVTEFPAAIPAILIGVLALVRVRRADPGGLPAAVGWIAAGVAIAATPLLVYDALAFDSPFRLGYSSEEGFREMRSGFFGITYPKLSTLGELLVGSYRGLLPLSPLMAVAAAGLVSLGRKGLAGPAIVAAGIAAYYLLLNASYFFWEGGWAYGPRQLTPGLPFIALGLAPLWDEARYAWRALFIAGWIWSVGITLIAVSTTPQPPSSFKAPVRELLWPAFRDGDLSLNHQTFVHYAATPDRLRGGTMPHAAWNLGELAGLHGLPSLFPLAAAWITAAALLLSLP